MSLRDNNLRIYDIIATNTSEELTNAVQLTEEDSTYNASSLGGGYSRDESGNLALNNEEITVQMIFKTDDRSTGYQKYAEVVNQLTNKEMVWLRYGVPLGGGVYTYAYRPGYISNITKSEGKYADKSLIEQVTISTLGGWFKLYKFSGPGSLSPMRAVKSEQALFSDYPENNKAIPYGFPYWYQIVRDVINNEEADRDALVMRKESWYRKWGNVLFDYSAVYKVFAIHAPSVSVSPDEEMALFDASNLDDPDKTKELVNQMGRKKGNSFASEKYSDSQKQLMSDIRKRKPKKGKKRKKQKRKSAQVSNFKARIENYSTVNIRGGYHVQPTQTRDDSDAFSGDYTSYLLKGSTSANGSLSFNTGSDILESKLTFLTSGNFVIDTAAWANKYSLNGSSVYIDFSQFFTTRVTTSTVLKASGVTFDTILMRRGVISV